MVEAEAFQGLMGTHVRSNEDIMFHDSRIPRVITKRNFSNMNLKITEDTQNSKSDDLEEGLKIASRFLNVSLGSTLEHLWPETTFSQIQSMTN